MSKSTSLPPKRVYWDACVFLSLIEGTPGRIPIIEALVDDCESGKIEIYSSMLSIAEVAFAKSEKDGKELSEEIGDKINRLWYPPAPFKLIEVHKTLVLEAQSYVRNAVPKSLGLKPPDAIHLVTAKKVNASVFHSYDDFKGKHEKVGEFLGIPIKQPKAEGFAFVDEQTSKATQAQA